MKAVFSRPEKPNPCKVAVRASSHGMRNELSLISEGAFDCLSLPFSFRKDEIFLIPCQTKARALNEPVKPIQAKVQLVAHPVGKYEA
jgi:hypothetical protein